MDFDQYVKLLLEANGQAFRSSSPWIFTDGMGFGDESVWWPSKLKVRPVPHEGLDLVSFRGDFGVKPLFAGFRVVSPVAGVVVGICPDFLAETVWIRSETGVKKVILLAHVDPAVTLGQRLGCGDPVGVISYPVTNVPLHLHLSVLVGALQSLPAMTWEDVHCTAQVKFISPLSGLHRDSQS